GETRIRHSRAERSPGNLPDRVGHSKITTGRSSLPGGELAAGGVDGKTPINGESGAAQKVGPPPLGKKSEVLKLHDADHGVIVVRLHEIDVLMTDARLRKQLV